LRTEFYNSRKQLKILTKAANQIGESTIHIDFINRQGKRTDGKSGRVEFDIKQDPTNKPEVILLSLLLDKLKNNTLTFEQLKTLIRLEHGFELTQTTRDKILIAVQGIIGTLRDRLKSAFGL